MPEFKLNKPIHINGGLVNELTYNFEDLTAKDLQDASKEYKKTGNMSMFPEFDSDYHLYLFAAAVRKASASIEVEDLLRLNAKDAIRAEALVRSFFFLDSVDSSAMNTSTDA